MAVFKHIIGNIQILRSVYLLAVRVVAGLVFGNTALTFGLFGFPA